MNWRDSVNDYKLFHKNWAKRKKSSKIVLKNENVIRIKIAIKFFSCKSVLVDLQKTKIPACNRF